MNKEELLQMALEADFEHFASEEAEWMDCSIDDLVSFVNAILERAAVECETDPLGSRCCADLIRALKTENSV